MLFFILFLEYFTAKMSHHCETFVCTIKLICVNLKYNRIPGQLTIE